ncbi:MAG: hypothetical protein BAJALOKI1v1_770007 [Promethearchaeota archaeon]|nr:MAG: hypothetical protein BAJALOKI1v1_770007 [Candidatus Lokiarchaeota archaeon]
MKETETLLTKTTIKAYLERMKQIRKLRSDKKAESLFNKEFVVETEQIDNLHLENKIGNFIIECDEDDEVGGSNKAPNPMQLLLSSLASCSYLTVSLICSLMKLKVTHLKLRLSAKYDLRALWNNETNDPPGFYAFHFKWFISTKEPLSKIKKVIQKAAEICPVRGTIEKSNSFCQDIFIED